MRDTLLKKIQQQTSPAYEGKEYGIDLFLFEMSPTLHVCRFYTSTMAGLLKQEITNPSYITIAFVNRPIVYKLNNKLIDLYEELYID